MKPPDKPPESRDHELARDFSAYHAAHPDVYQLFCAMVLWLMATGIRGTPLTRFSALGVLALVRATSNAGDRGDNRFRINNNFARFYADMFCAQFPDRSGFFTKRERISKKQPPVNRPALTPKDFEGDDE